MIVEQGPRYLQVKRRTTRDGKVFGHVMVVWSRTSPTARAGIILTREQCIAVGTELLDLAMGHERTET